MVPRQVVKEVVLEGPIARKALGPLPHHLVRSDHDPIQTPPFHLHTGPIYRALQHHHQTHVCLAHNMGGRKVLHPQPSLGMLLSRLRGVRPLPLQHVLGVVQGYRHGHGHSPLHRNQPKQGVQQPRIRQPCLVPNARHWQRSTGRSESTQCRHGQLP